MLRAAGLLTVGLVLLAGCASGQEPAARQTPPETLVTKVAVCVETSGRISSAELLKSSGDPKLDELTLKELVKQRMPPAKGADGKPMRVCNHIMDIEWPPPH